MTTALAPYEMPPPLLATVKAVTPTQLVQSLDDDFLGLVAVSCFKGKCTNKPGWKPRPVEMQEFLWKAYRSGLDPFLGQIVAVMRDSTAAGRPVLAVQTTAEGYGAIAENSGQLISISPVTFDRERGVDDTKPPVWAECTVTRELHGREVPFTRRLYYREYVRKTAPWREMPWHMLALRVECHAIKAAFRNRTSGLSLPKGFEPRGEDEERPEILDVEFKEQPAAEEPATEPEPEPEPEPEDEQPEAPRRAPPPVLGGAR